MRAFPLSVFLFLSLPVAAEDQLETSGPIDGSAQIVITHTNAFWTHLSGDLSATSLTLNGVPWKPSEGLTLPNSGAATFLTNSVNFLSAVLDVIHARDTIVLQREPSRLVLSVADTPPGPGNYHAIIRFPAIPTLTVQATIDGSDELHVSFSGARWIHKHWSAPTDVSLNGVAWATASGAYLTNAGATLFLPDPVQFHNAKVLSSSGPGLLTVRPAENGLIINFADDIVGPGPYEAVIGFPPGESSNAALTVRSSTSISAVPAAGIAVQTTRGVNYELQFSTNLTTGGWHSTGSFLRGSGGTMTLFDPLAPRTVFYRVVSVP